MITHRATTLFFLLTVFVSGLVAAQAASAPTAKQPVEPSVDVTGFRGNWVNKREWLTQAQSVNEQLQRDVAGCAKARTKFMSAFERADKGANEFYARKGIMMGTLEELITELQADVKAENDRRITQAKEKAESDDLPMNYYDVQIEAIEDDVKRFEGEVEQFKLDLQAIADLDASLTKRLEVLDERISEAGKLGTQSAEKLDQMWWMIDDLKARDAFYEIQDLADRIASIKSYVEGALLKDFEKVSGTVQAQIDQVQSQIEALEQRGLIVEHRTERLADKKIETQREQLAQEAEQAEEAMRSKKRRKRKKTTTMGSLLYAPIELVFGCARLVGNAILSPFYALGRLVGLGGSKPAKKRRKQRRPVEPVADDEAVVESGS